MARGHHRVSEVLSSACSRSWRSSLLRRSAAIRRGIAPPTPRTTTAVCSRAVRPRPPRIPGPRRPSDRHRQGQHRHAEGAMLPALATPLTVTTATRGEGGATITPVTVNGKTTSIEWNAGQPLPLEGDGGSLVLGPIAVDVGTDIVLVLDGVHSLAPGSLRSTRRSLSARREGLGHLHRDGQDDDQVPGHGNDAAANAGCPRHRWERHGNDLGRTSPSSIRTDRRRRPRRSRSTTARTSSA